MLPHSPGKGESEDASTLVLLFSLFLKKKARTDVGH
jgi:hypothetical protein